MQVKCRSRCRYPGCTKCELKKSLPKKEVNYAESASSAMLITDNMANNHYTNEAYLKPTAAVLHASPHLELVFICTAFKYLFMPARLHSLTQGYFSLTMNKTIDLKLNLYLYTDIFYPPSQVTNYSLRI